MTEFKVGECKLGGRNIPADGACQEEEFEEEE
jgi:hypothetical protein